MIDELTRPLKLIGQVALVDLVGSAEHAALYEPDTLRVEPTTIEWESMETALHPAREERGDERLRARCSVAAFAACLSHLVSPDDRDATRIVDPCCGTGDLVLPLARVLGVGALAADIDPRPLATLRARTEAGGLAEGVVRAVQGDAACLAQQMSPSGGDVVVALRSCGSVADLIVKAAVAAQAPFLVSPCCIWKALVVQDTATGADDGSSPVIMGAAARPDVIAYPRSQWLARYVDADGYRVLAEADDSPGLRASAMLGDGSRTLLWRRAQRIIEQDRLMFAAEQGFATRLLRFPGGDNPHTALLAGAPAGSKAARALWDLPTTDSVCDPLFCAFASR